MRLTSPRGLARRGAFVFSRARVSRLILGALSIVGALWAVGCGGGGSDSSPIPPPPPPISPITLTISPPITPLPSTVSLPSPPISPLAVEGNGTANNPILLGNIYQLQFIGGTLSAEAARQITVDFQNQLQDQLQSIGDRLSAEARRQLTEDFRFDAVAAQSVAMSDFRPLTMRMTLHYKLTADLDLSAAAEWDGGRGFAPIGSHSVPFSGIFNGDSYVLRGLRIRRGDQDGIGFFAYLGGGARVVSLGIADARVEGQMNVGALAGEVLAATVYVGLEDARLEDVWAWGRVFGSNGSLTTGVGGLVGRLEGGQIVRGWFGGHVEDGDSTGGLVGFAEIDDGQRIEDSWAMAAVSGNNMVGGLLGGAGDDLHLPPVIYRSWAAGPIYPMPLSDSGLVGGLVGESSGVYSTDSFSGIETSGQTLAGDGGIAVDSILTLTVFNLTAGVASTVWNFGGDSNFPVLRAGDSDLQKVAMAYGLTRLSVGAGDLWSVFPIGVTMTINGDNEAILALDVNGLAANPGDAGGATPNTPTPDCRFFNDRMEAVTNYNGARVRMWMVADNAVLRAYSGGDECYARVIGSSGGGTLRVDFAVGAQRMTLDYPFRIEGSVNPPFGVSFPSGVSRFEVIENTKVEIRLVGLLATFTSEQPDSPDDFTVDVMDGSLFVMPDEPLTTIFDADEREVMLTLTAMDALSQQTITLVAVLVSPPRPFDGANSETRVTATVARTEVLSAADVSISLWHLFGKSTVFSLADSVSDLFGVNSESGRVYLAEDPDPGENNRVYSLVLQGRPDDNGVLGEQIGKQTIRVLLGNPLLEVIGDGSADNPYIIDDIYELQAINGILPGEAADKITMSLGMTAADVQILAASLFSKAPRSEANYRLGADIDATPTNDWGVLKFKPIDGFTGVLDGCVTSACDGGVYVVRGLVINRTGGINIGLFSEIIKSGSNELAVHDLGVEDANINGGRNVGIIAGRTENAGFRKVWTSGRVSGGVDGGTGDNVGGLIGSIEGGSGSTVMMSWSTADVEGSSSVGGISGNAFGNNEAIGFSDNWAAGEVIGVANAGGFSGFAENINYFRNWSSGAVSGADGGFLGQEGSEFNNFRDFPNYWDLNTSGVPRSPLRPASGNVVGVALQTLTAGDFGGNPIANAWVFGRRNDFPLLSVFSRPLQAVYLTRALTRILPLNGALELDALTVGSLPGLEADGFRLDTNGLAANGGASCRFSRGVLRAQTNYNDTVVEMRLLTAGGERLTHVAGSCDTRIEGITDVFTATLRLEISAPASGGNEARRLTVDYTAEIAPSLEFDNFSDPPIVVAANATMNTPVLTISADQSRVLFFSAPTADADFTVDGLNDNVTIYIGKPATEVFNSDGKRVTIIVNAMGLGDTKDLTVVFVSAPRVISSADGFIGLNAARAFAGATILEDGNSGLTILHSDNDNEIYTINSAGGTLQVDRTSGVVTARRNLQFEVNYVATLVLTNSVLGVAAVRVLTVAVSRDLAIRVPPPQPAVVALGALPGDFVYSAFLLGGDDMRSFDPASTDYFGTDGGKNEARITIKRAATLVFAEDEAMAEIALTASDSTLTVTATVNFVSAPLAIDADPLTQMLTRSESAVRANEELLPAVSLTILHSNNTLEIYELSGTAADHFTVGADGAISVGATDLSPGGYSFALELIAADGVTRARRGLSLRVTEALTIVEIAQPVEVAAAATLNAEVLTVLLRGGTNSSFAGATDDNFKTGGGGEQVTVSLARAATEVFDSDGAMRDFVLTANADGETATATIRFVSAPRAIVENSELFSISLSSPAATVGAEILAGGESELAIWHFDGETYALANDAGGNFEVDGATGRIVIASGSLNSAEGSYEFQLQLSGDGETATREIRVDVGALTPLVIESVPVPEDRSVAAAATINTKVLTVLLSGGVNSSFAVAADDNFKTGGGAQAVVSLARAATAAFNADNAMLDFVLTASADDGIGGTETATLTVQFVSAPRAIVENSELFSISLSSAEAIADAEILAGGASGLAIWHFDGETYALVGAGGNFELEGVAGRIVIASGGLDSLDSPYNLTLQLSGGGQTATREIRVHVAAPPPPPQESLNAAAAFVEAIAAGDFNWFANTVDWDNDGILNPYDWTPTVNAAGVTVNLTLGGADGSARRPWPIYNVWQLQAIDGVSVSEGGTQSGNFALFGAGASDRLGAQYSLAVDIDATPTKEWKNNAGNTVGFDPIGGSFTGFLNGGGYAVRGLFVDKGTSSYAGLFSAINAGGKLAVSDLGVEDAEIRGGGFLGIIAGEARGASFQRVWTTGKVIGSGIRVGGLVGDFYGDPLVSVVMSWSAADVSTGSSSDSIGGLFGSAIWSSATSGEEILYNDNWVAGNVVTDALNVGGFSGFSGAGNYARNWSSGAVLARANGGGFVGEGSNNKYANVYWNKDTSGGLDSSRGGLSGSNAIVLQTLTSAAFGGAAASAWDFGDSDLSGGADFPLLTVHSLPLQAINLARALTRILVVADAATIAVAAGTTVTTANATIRLDTNGLASDTGTDGTSIPSCAVEDGELLANANYNGVSVKLALITRGDEAFVATANDCEVTITNAEGESDAILRVEISAPATLAYAARSLTTDYELRLDAPPVDPAVAAEDARNARDGFVAEIAAGDFDWFSNDGGKIFGGTSLDWDGDGIDNPYDWTPTSVLIDGRLVSVNLTLSLTGEFGTAGNPWPIYNVWQLQAIEGVSVSHDGTQSGNLTLFGGGNARVAAQYRLATNIDATPTKQWKTTGGITLGFDPIGGTFSGFFDGGGYAVRGLFIDRRGAPTAGERDRVGLFRDINKSGELAVINLGVEDADIRGRTDVGIIAGRANASFSKVWTTGEVVGADEVAAVGGAGGLIANFGARDAVNTIMMSWSAANINANGGQQVGGLVGVNAQTGDNTIDNNWAAGNVRGNRAVAGGFSGNAANATLNGNWSSGVVSGNSDVGGFIGSASRANIVSGYWNRDTSDQATSAGGVAAVVQTLAAVNFGGDDATLTWAFGEDDFPLLTVLSRPWQAVNLARSLTRIFGVGDAEATEAATGITFTTNGVRLDTNGLAPDTGSGGTSIPTCAVVGGELLAQTNYNDITTKLILITDGTQALVSVAATDTHCEVGFANAEDEFAATLRVEISAPAIGDDPAHTARSLTTDYALRIAPERLAAAREMFVAEIARGDFNWFSNTLIIGSGTTLDWDDDGIDNPYDWTPTSITINGRTVGVDLTSHFTGEGGTAGNPWPIYNVWQLQAIDGVSVSHTGETGTSDIFGGGRLAAQYRLALDIDATPTKQWDSEAGFDPIGGSFSGFLDGGGYAVRGLVINRGGDANVGLFANIAKSDGGLAVRNMGVEDANIRGAGGVGILAGFVTDASFSEVWTTGQVRGAGQVGGLIGYYVKSRNNSAIRMSWSAADVVSSANAFGGLIGFQQGSGGSFNIDDNWAAGDVRGVGSAGSAGGFSGFPFVGDYARNWSSGAISSSGDFVGGFSGNVISGGAEYIYWNEDTSGLTASTASGEAAVVQTLVASNFGGGASSAWAGLDDNADFPLLTVHSRPWQAVNLARALTRVLLVNDGGGSDAEGTDLAIANEIRLDTNGRAPDTGIGGTSIPTCELVDNELRAQTNYNGVMVKLTMMTSGDESFVKREGCEVGFENVTGEFAATLRVEISAPATVIDSTRTDLARSLTTDYALRIALDSDTGARDEFVRMIEAGDFDWFAASLTVAGAGGNPGDWDNDGTQNRYDWTPTSIRVGGVLTQVDLRLGEERNRGTAANPYPIYNVWQLQAIDGIRVDAGVTSEDFSLFGANEIARLGSHYRLAVDIDATPTRDWQTIGFNPIGAEDNNITTNFIGAFDGEGREIRGLFMNSSDANAALFDHVGTGGRVSRVGLRDVDVRVRDGGNRAAGAVARLDGGTVSLVWASGTVQGALFNNAGLVGYLESGELRESWFVGDIEGNGGNGGLVGLMATGEIADSWAMAEVRQIGDNQPNGGLIGRANGGALTTSWSGGPVADGDNSGGIIGKPTTDDSVLAGGAIYLDTSTSGESKFEANNVAADIITVRTMATVRSGFDEAVWNYGAEAATDYPFLHGIESFRPGLQAALFADFQTQILPLIGEATLSVGGRTAMRQDESVNLILDTNGRAVGAPTPIPSCEAGATTAKTNYNNVTVRLRATDAGSVVFTDNCEIAFRFADSIGGATEFSAEVLIVSGEITILNWTHSFDLEAALDSSAMEAMTIFVADIADGDFNWFSNALIVGSGSSIDWDNDGIANPYDWTPTSVVIGDGRSIGVNLTLEGVPDGSAAMPWPIYNVWQLQAIDGMSVSHTGATVGGFTLFAATEADRLSMGYALALDIDATPTRGWGTVGFNPIGFSPEGGTGLSNVPFTGFLDGNGFAVRGLFVNQREGGDIGMFSIIDRDDGELAVTHLGVEDAEIFGNARVGILVGQAIDASFSRVWTTGKVFASNGGVGGLIGAYNKSGTNSANLMMSWSTADIESVMHIAGGLLGNHGRRVGTASTDFNFNDNWAAGSVRGNLNVGGFSGLPSDVGTYARNWSAGVVSGNAVSGFADNSIVGEYAYWNVDTSGVDASMGGEGVVVQALTEFDFGGDIESAAWDFGDNDISNGDADFPLLDNLSQPWQAVNLARALTRLLGVGEAAAITVATGVTLTTNGIRLDTNGLAADMGSRGTSTPTCAFVSASGVFRAQTNYNGVTVDLSLLAGGGEAFAEISAENTANCEIGFANATGEFAATLRVEISAPVIDGDPARGLTTDYALRIKPNIPAAARAAFVREIARDDFDWYSNALIVGGGSTLDWDNDGVLNPYDWTPTSVAIIDGGDLFEVNLTLGGANGSTRLPWPIYNIWQLQAIDGISISETGKRSDTFAFFGANAAAALTAQYRLELNIDASPTENWDAISGLSTFGFDPIGGNFTGYMDGQGFAVRGLFIDRGSDNIGLFSRISKTGEMAVWNMGVEDADIRGGNRSGILVGENNANLGRIWTTGSVRGGNSVGGVAGQLTGQSNTVMMSWSTADVDGGEQVGGISGFNFPEDAAHRVFYNDNWAGGNVNSADAACGRFCQQSLSLQLYPQLVCRRGFGQVGRRRFRRDKHSPGLVCLCLLEHGHKRPIGGRRRCGRPRCGGRVCANFGGLQFRRLDRRRRLVFRRQRFFRLRRRFSVVDGSRLAVAGG